MTLNVTYRCSFFSNNTNSPGLLTHVSPLEKLRRHRAGKVEAMKDYIGNVTVNGVFSLIRTDLGPIYKSRHSKVQIPYDRLWYSPVQLLRAKNLGLSVSTSSDGFKLLRAPWYDGKRLWIPPLIASRMQKNVLVTDWCATLSFDAVEWVDHAKTAESIFGKEE